MALGDRVRDLLEAHRELGDQDHVRAPRDPGLERDPARVPPHHLDHHHAVVGLRRRVDPVDGFGGDRERGVESERVVGPVHVVVDRLRNPDHRKPRSRELPSHAQRVLAPDRDHRVDLAPGERLPDPRLSVRLLVWIRPGGPEDRPTSREDPRHRAQIERLDLLEQESAPPVSDSRDRPPAPLPRGVNDRPDHRVEPRTVPSTRQDTHSHRARGPRTNSRNDHRLEPPILSPPSHSRQAQPWKPSKVSGAMRSRTRERAKGQSGMRDEPGNAATSIGSGSALRKGEEPGWGAEARTAQRARILTNTMPTNERGARLGPPVRLPRPRSAEPPFVRLLAFPSAPRS